MCVISERQSAICGHVARHTEPCARKKCQSVLKIFSPKCVPTRRTASYYEICYECKRLWQLYGVSEGDAIERTLAYRREDNYFGPLSPHSIGRAPPQLMQEINLNPDNENDSRSKVLADRVRQVVRNDTNMTNWVVSDGETPEKQEIPAGHEEDLTNWLIKQAMGKASSPKRESSATMLTQWPEVPSSEVLGPNIKGKTKMASKGRAEDTELESLGNQQVKVNTYGFEKQDLCVPFPRQPVHNLIPGGQEPHTPTQVKAPPDLNKPLPPLPRRDSPMPGRQFNSENPERDVSYGKYIPRFI
jgi:hypothetical protein